MGVYFAHTGRASAEFYIMLPTSASGRKSGFRAGFRPDSSEGGLKIGPPAGPPAGLRLAGGPILN